MMDYNTQKVLKLIEAHSKIKNFLTYLSYFLIIGGLFIYIFYAINKTNQDIRVISQIKKDGKNYKIEKIMTNPRINFQYNKNEVYRIKASKAHHEDEEKVVLYDVSASGNIGNITSGQLSITEQGDRLIFTKNPVLILNKTQNYQ